MTNKPTTILLVDDKDWTRYTVSRLLQSERYVVREAPTGADALRLAAQKPDLIILDIKLPDLDGYEVCRRIKADPATASIPVLHLSATFVESDSRSTGLEGGADGYLTYPVESRELVAHVEALLRTRKAERAARDQEELLRVTLSSIADAVIATDIHGNVTFLNPVAQELCGWSAEEAIGAPLARVFHIVDEQTREVMEDPVARVVREERAVRLPGRTVLIAKDLVERPIEDNGAPIRDEEGNLRGVVLVFRDVAQRRAGEEALRRAEERLRLMVDSVQDYAIFTLDPVGTDLELGHRRRTRFRLSGIRDRRSKRYHPLDPGGSLVAACPRKNLSPRKPWGEPKTNAGTCARTAAGSSPAAWSRPSADLPASCSASRRSRETSPCAS